MSESFNNYYYNDDIFMTGNKKSEIYVYSISDENSKIIKMVLFE